MELIHATHHASKFEAEDFISDMPDNVVTHIMDQLPIRDAVRTSVLSRSWRFKWTMLSQLVFDKNFFVSVSKPRGETNFGIITSRLLHHPKVVITKFVLYINELRYFVNVEDISYLIQVLSTKGIKDLTLQKWSTSATPLKLSKHLFSCLELKHLKLENCCFDPPTSYHGFPNLLSLELREVEFERGKIGEFLSWCPIIETLNISSPYRTARVLPIEFAKLASLKTLSLFLCNLDKPSSSSIFELVVFLPKLQELHINFMRCKLIEDDAEKSFPTTFPCLKTLKLSRIDVADGITLSYVFEMVKSFSNLQTLTIVASEQHTGVAPLPEIDYNVYNVEQLQLQSLVFTFFTASNDEICFIKYLLACSPFLKKSVFRPHPFLDLVDQLRFARKLLKLQRNYPAVYMDLYSSVWVSVSNSC